MISSNNAGGVFTGITLNGTIFDPLVSGPGDYLVGYSITDVHSCQNSTSQLITVVPDLYISYLNLLPTYCSNEPKFTLQALPSGGTFSGPGISAGNEFDASAAGEGVHTITYTVQDAVTGCIHRHTGICRDSHD